MLDDLDELTDEERQRQGGAPADFGGSVFPNPRGVKVSDDTESGIPPTRLPKGVSFHRENSSGSMPTDISNPPAAELIGDGLQTASTAPKIARPAPASEGISVRGVNTEDAPPSISTSPSVPNLPSGKPTIPSSPLQQQTEQDRRTQQQLGKGSGITQIGNPWARGALRGLNIAGDLASAVMPQVGTALRAIPGTEEHHQSLVKQNTAALTNDEAQAEKEAQTQQQSAQTEETQAHTAQIQQQTADAGKPKPKEEDWSVVPGMVGPNGQLVQQEKTSGQIRFAPDISGVGPVKPPAAEFENYYQQFLKDNKFPDTAHNRLLAKEQFDRAEHSVQARGQDMTDARARELNQINRETKQETAKDKADTALAGFNSDLDRLAAAANELVNDPGLAGITGIKGKLPNLPGSAAANAEAKLNALKSQVAFGVLQNMRNNSKTGGALGAVSDKEGELLQNNLASLDKSQSHGELAGSLRKIIQYTADAKERARAAFQNTYPGAKETSAAAGGGAFKVPTGAPPAPKEDGHTLKSNGEAIAVSKGGQWVAP